MVAGAGIAGAECALTLAAGLEDASVTLVGNSPLRLLPDLLYVPFGVEPRRLEVALESEISGHGVHFVEGRVDRVEPRERMVVVDGKPVSYDTLVIASGSESTPLGGLGLRTPDDAFVLRARLAELLERPRTNHARASVVLRAAAEDSWTPPAYEFACLLDRWLGAEGVRDRVEISIVTGELRPFEWFGPHVGDAMTQLLKDRDIEVAAGVPESRLDAIEGDVTVDFDRLRARHLPGSGPLDERGWYPTDAHGCIDDHVYVVGDAANVVYKAAFATAWQSRRVLHHLGGSLASVGVEVDDVPVDEIIYELDLGDSTFTVTMAGASALRSPHLGHDTECRVHDGAPDKLAGTLVRDRLLRTPTTAGRRFRDLLGMQAR